MTIRPRAIALATVLVLAGVAGPWTHSRGERALYLYLSVEHGF
jgi:hypothetical protein